MKIINVGSLNIDKVYKVDDIASEGHTISCSSLETFCGGKGLNQSLAVSRAGARCVHIGAIGPEGVFLEDYLKQSGVDTSLLKHVDSETGHAIIQVNSKGQNSIIVYGGANTQLGEDYLSSALEKSVEEGDIVLLQNETDSIGFVMEKARSLGAKVVFNPSPFPSDVSSYPLDCVDIFMLNEHEAAQLAGLQGPDVIKCLMKRFPHAQIVMTLGSEGVSYGHNGNVIHSPSYKVQAVDTTGAGDTFCGYFLAMLSKGLEIPECLKYSCAAAAISVTRPGAGPSIPRIEEVQEFLAH